MTLIRRHPLVAFFVLAYALSWWPSILYALDLLPQPIVGFGPFLAALVVLGITQGKTGIVGLLRRMMRWRVAPVWYAVALLLPVAIALAAAVFNVPLGSPLARRRSTSSCWAPRLLPPRQSWVACPPSSRRSSSCSSFPE